MTEKAATAVLGTLASFRTAFVSVAAITFILLAAAIFAFIHPRSLVRSAIEVGALFSDKKEEPIEAPDLLAKRVQAVYVPAALMTLSKSGVPQSTLGALQNSSADSIGLTVSIQSTVDPAAAEDAKAFQQKILDQIVEEEGKRMDLMREAAAARSVLLKQTSDAVDQQIADHEKMLDRLGGLIPAAESSLRDRDAERSTALQRAATQPDRGDKTGANLEGLRREIAANLELLGTLNEDRAQSTRDLTGLRARHDNLVFALFEAQIAARTIKNTRVTLAPEVMPQPVGARRLPLLFIAAVASILIAFGAVAFLHSFAVRRS